MDLAITARWPRVFVTSSKRRLASTRSIDRSAPAAEHHARRLSDVELPRRASATVKVLPLDPCGGHQGQGVGVPALIQRRRRMPAFASGDMRLPMSKRDTTSGRAFRRTTSMSPRSRAP